MLFRSPSIYDGEAIKNIDYDLDVKVSPQGKTVILDEDEYCNHAQEMAYGEKLDRILHHELDRLLIRIRQKSSPFYDREIWELYERYLSLI